MISMTSSSVSSQKNQENKEDVAEDFKILDELHSANRNSLMLDEFSDEDEEFQVAEVEHEVCIPLFCTSLLDFILHIFLMWIFFISGA